MKGIPPKYRTQEAIQKQVERNCEVAAKKIITISYDGEKWILAGDTANWRHVKWVRTEGSVRDSDFSSAFGSALRGLIFQRKDYAIDITPEGLTAELLWGDYSSVYAKEHSGRRSYGRLTRELSHASAYDPEREPTGAPVGSNPIAVMKDLREAMTDPDRSLPQPYHNHIHSSRTKIRFAPGMATGKVVDLLIRNGLQIKHVFFQRPNVPNLVEQLKKK